MAGSLVGSIYARGVPSSGYNDKYKDNVNGKLLSVQLRFNTEMKMYTGKVNSPEQAIMVRDAAKMVCEADEVSAAASQRLACLPRVRVDA